MNNLILTQRQNGLAENYELWCQIEILVSKLNADDQDSTFGFSIRSKDQLLSNIRNARAYIAEVWESEAG